MVLLPVMGGLALQVPGSDHFLSILPSLYSLLQASQWCTIQFLHAKRYHTNMPTISWEEGKQRDPTDENSLFAPIIIIIIIIPSQEHCNEGITWTAMEECHSCLFGVTARKIQLLFSSCFSVCMPEICLLHR